MAEFSDKMNNNQSKSFKYDQQSNSENKKETNQQKRTSRRKEQRKNHDQTNKDDILKDQKSSDVQKIKEISSDHLEELKIHFNKIIDEYLLSSSDEKEYLEIFHYIEKVILNHRSDARIQLYGSLLFKCFLKEKSVIDIDVQFNDMLPYQTLKELLEIFRTSVSLNDIHLNVEEEEMFLDVSLVNLNTRIRITSGNVRSIYSTKLIELYTRFDQRVLKLLRLFHILCEICEINRPDLGTLSPIVCHLMIIYFLQQIEFPIIPCLHEYVFGIDHVPIVLNDDQYVQFFSICDIYSKEWKSLNETSVEMVFLQFLSYYDTRFNYGRSILSVQTRMPIIKNERQMYNRKLFCADPTSFNRNLSYTIKASSSFTYFTRTIRKARRYFSRTRSIPLNQLINFIDQSYTSFNDHFPKNIEQEKMREFDKQMINHSSKTIVEIDNRRNEDSISSIDLDHNKQNEMIPSVRKVQLLSINGFERLVISTISNEENLSSIEKKRRTTNVSSSSGSFYNMQPKNFGAEKGAPSVCLICYRNSHLRSECPELFLPEMISLPHLTREWKETLSRVCRQVSDEYRSTKKDIHSRKEIVRYFQLEFEKCYPCCSIHTYGSSNNGFTLRQSDLDICVQLKETNNESHITILEKLFQIIQFNSSIFRNVELVRDARIPVIRLIHSQSQIEIDISLNNLLALENTRLLKIYSEIDPRVSELGYMIKCLAKSCDIGNVSRGTLSSYAYILMLIHFLQQIQPPILPVLQQLSDDPSNDNGKIQLCEKWNVYFYKNLNNLKEVWTDNRNGPNLLTSAQLWIEFLGFYTERFDYQKNVVTIRQLQPLSRKEKGWFRQTIAIEDPFLLTHNLADRLSLLKWTLIRRVFIRARERFGTSWNDNDIRRTKLTWISDYLFDIYALCPENAEKFYYNQSTDVNDKQTNIKSDPMPLTSADNHRSKQNKRR